MSGPRSVRVRVLRHDPIVIRLDGTDLGLGPGERRVLSDGPAVRLVAHGTSAADRERVRREGVLR